MRQPIRLLTYNNVLTHFGGDGEEEEMVVGVSIFGSIGREEGKKIWFGGDCGVRRARRWRTTTSGSNRRVEGQR